jgi:hypothetical protein
MRSLVILLTFFALFSFSQSKDKISVKKNTKGDQPFYHTKMSDVLYIGVGNRFILYKDPSKKYSVTIKNGTILPKDETSKDSTIYSVTVTNSEPTFVYVTVDGKTYSYKFRNKTIPSPEIKIFIGTKFISDTEIPAESFKNAQSLLLDLSNFDFDVGFYIVGMRLTIVKNGQKKEHLLTDHNIAEFTKTAASGDIYIFDQVVIEFSNTKAQRTINGKTFFVK